MIMRNLAQHDIYGTYNSGPSAHKDSLLASILKEITTKHGILIGFSHFFNIIVAKIIKCS